MRLAWSGAANVATVVVAICAIVVTASTVRGRDAVRSSRADFGPDTVRVADWEKYVAGGHSRGPTTAAVTILEFGDYECPFCARFDVTMNRILTAYPADVRYVYRHWPLPNHRFAYPAARAAECAADQSRFWELHHLLYSKQDSLGLLTFSDFARQAGVGSVTQFETCVRQAEPVPAIEEGARAARAVGATGTPAVLVNGLLIRGGVDSAYVARLLARAAK